MTTVTVQDIELAMPPSMKSVATQSLADSLNNLQADPDAAREIRANFITYAKVLTEGKFKVEDYLNAVTYASWKIAGYTNQDAYIATFPDRHAKMLASGKTAKDISAYVSMYHKNKLVNLILTQAAIPVYILNQDMFQRALNVQLDLATDPNQSGMVRTTAANSLLNALAKPKEAVAAAQINLNVVETDGIRELKNSIEELSRIQIEAMKSGKSAAQIASMDITELEIINERP